MPAVAKPRRARPAPPAGRAAPVQRRAAPKPPAGRGARPAPRPRKPETRTAATAARRRAARPAPAPVSRRLPGWGDLDGSTPETRRPQRAAIDAMPSLRLAAWALVGCLGLTLYVGHVYATRATLESLQEARRENLQVHLASERLRGTFDAMTGPAQILPRAAALGLEEGIAYAPPIHLHDGG